MPGAKWTTWLPFALPLRATQILAADSFKREGNRTKRSGHSNHSHRLGYRHRQKESRQLFFLHAREFHRTLSDSPRTASNEKEITRNKAYTPTSSPGKDTCIGRRNSASYSFSTLEIFTVSESLQITLIKHT